MFVIRKKLSADEITPPTIRYNADCDCIQTTFDGGATWTDSPGSDPRSSPAFRAPPSTEDDPRCTSAAGMVALLRSLVDADQAADSAAGLVVLWFAILLAAFPFVGWVADLLLLIADAIVSIGGAAISTAFTEDVYTQFLCVFYDNIDTDGQMSDAQLSDIYTQVATDFDLTVQAVFGLHSSGLGAVGWSNAGALATTSADCGSCLTWCIDVDLAVSDFDMSTDTSDWGPGAVYVLGTGWTAALDEERTEFGDCVSQFRFGRLFPNTVVTRIEANFDIEFGNQSSFDSFWKLTLGDEIIFDIGNTNTSGNHIWTGSVATGDDSHLWFDRDGSSIGYNAFGCPAGGSAQAVHLHMEGTGDNPLPDFACA